MATSFQLPPLFLSYFLASLALISAQPTPNHYPCSPPLFVFGASMVDVGQNAAAMPLRSPSEFPPYWMDYFHRPAKRFSNGRVFMDFISQGMGYGLLDPYLRSVRANFKHGVNFASSGSTAQNATVSGNGSSSSGLFSLMVQVAQFIDFRHSVLAANRAGENVLNTLPSVLDLANAVYFIETAHNDYLDAYSRPGFDALATVLAVRSAIEEALKKLYKAGARNIITMNLTPLGCTPGILASYNNSALDNYGCHIDFNQIVNLHNIHLQQLIDKLSAELPLAKWIIFDAYSIMLDGYHNPSKYGVKYPLQACCGAGGKYNYVSSIGCGESGYENQIYVEGKRCKDPSLHIIWDSIHPVESFGYHMANGVLSGNYLKPTFSIKETCKSHQVD